MRVARPLISLAALALLSGGLACKKPQPLPPPPPAEPPVVEAPKAPVVAPKPPEDPAAAEKARLEAYRRAAEVALKDINFDFDQSDIREVDKPKLQAIAAFLRDYPDAKLSVEGHCDERGTVEYNLALGERRAHAAQRYLVGLGVAEPRLTTISFGKERPKVTTSDEQSWLINRRAEFKLR